MYLQEYFGQSEFYVVMLKYIGHTLNMNCLFINPGKRRRGWGGESEPLRATLRPEPRWKQKLEDCGRRQPTDILK